MQEGKACTAETKTNVLKIQKEITVQFNKKLKQPGNYVVRHIKAIKGLITNEAT